MSEREHSISMRQGAAAASAAPDFPAAPGECAALIRALDWSATALGPSDSWSVTLRTTLITVLHSPVPMVLVWGPQGMLIYNDGYAVFAGARHPEILGMPALAAWPEVADLNRSVIEAGQRLQTLSFRGEKLRLHRPGRPDELWVDLDYSPVVNESGQCEGVLCVLSEITDRVVAEAALRMSERRLSLSQRAGGIGTFEVDSATGMITVSDEFRRVWGLGDVPVRTADDLSALIVGEDRNAAGDSRRVSSGEMNLYAEYRVRQPSTGQVVWLARRGEFERDASGKPARLYGAVYDITLRKRAEEHYRTLAETLPQLVWATHPDGAVSYLSRQWVEFTGISEATQLGHRWLDVIHPDDRERTRLHWLGAVGGAHAYDIDYRMRRHDGAWRWFKARATSIRGDDGQISSWFGTCTDIEDIIEARELQERLSEQLEREVAERTRELDRIWRVSQDLLVVADNTGVWLTVNPAVELALGHSLDAMLGRTTHWMEHPDDHVPTRQEVANLSAGQRTMRFDHRLRHRDGSYRFISWTAVSDEGRIYAVGRDVTNEKDAAEALVSAQEALRQSQKMEAIGHLTGGVAHDFNNLLTIVIGNIDTIERNLPTGLDRIRRSAENAMQGARRAAALTQRLLAFSRRQPLEPKPLDANKLVASMSEMLNRTLGEQIEIQTVLAGGLWRAEADHNQLEAALLNLAVNARDAMPDGGKLTIETSNTYLDSAYAARSSEVIPGQYIAICVSDTGIGMAREIMERVFEPFFTTKPTGHGTGLGLSQVYGFVKQSGGHVKIYSEMGEGTTVRIYLPRLLRAVDEEEPPEAPTIPDGLASETVLVVEDEDGVRQYTVDILRELGYRVIEARDAGAALRQLDRTPDVRLLFTDVGLPGMNGRQLAEEVLKRRPDVKVLFATGYAQNAIVHHGRLDAGVALVGKPFTYAMVAAKIREVLDGL